MPSPFDLPKDAFITVESRSVPQRLGSAVKWSAAFLLSGIGTITLNAPVFADTLEFLLR